METEATRQSILAMAMHLDVIDDCYDRLNGFEMLDEHGARYAVKQLSLMRQHIDALVEQLQVNYNLPRA
jgi:hypothetical protein